MASGAAVPAAICFVFKRMDVGGAELRTIEIAEAFPGVDFVFATVSSKPGALDAELRARGHDVIATGWSLTGHWRLLSAMWSGRVGVLHSQLGAASGLHVLAAAVLRVPVRVAHFRSDDTGGRRSMHKSVGLAVSRSFLKRCATIIAGVSPGSLEYGWSASWRSDTRCQVIPNLIDTARLEEACTDLPADLATPPAGGRVKLCHIGRREPSKRQDLAVEIWEHLARTSSSSLHLIGSLSLAATAAIESVPRERSADVFSHSYVRNAGRVLKNMSVCLVTSTREGLPGVVLEALASGVPVVATDLPGVRWISEQVEGVYRVRSEAAVDEWTQAITAALETDSLRIRGSFSSSLFASSDVLDRYAEVWRLPPRVATSTGG